MSITTIKSLTNAQRISLYNALAGKTISKFASVEKGISQCIGVAKVAGEIAVTKALADIGVNGVAPEPKPEPKAKAKPVKAAEPKPEPKAKAKPVKAAEPKPEKVKVTAKTDAKEKAAAPTGDSNPKPKSRIIEKVEALLKKPKPEPKPEKTSGIITAVQPTFKGTSRVGKNSNRGAVLAIIEDHKNGITIADLEKKANVGPVRGYVQKLIEKSHCTAIELKPAV